MENIFSITIANMLDSLKKDFSMARERYLMKTEIIIRVPSNMERETAKEDTITKMETHILGSFIEIKNMEMDN
jgi:hypothetical protein